MKPETIKHVKNNDPTKKKVAAICVVDDDPIMVFCIKKLLAKVVECDTITTHRNGKIALDYILDLVKNNEKLPSVIFLDINMPVMDGWQFLDEFINLQLEQSVKISIVTSSIDPADQEKCSAYTERTKHNISYSNKPIDKKLLEEIVADVK